MLQYIMGGIIVTKGCMFFAVFNLS